MRGLKYSVAATAMLAGMATSAYSQNAQAYEIDIEPQALSAALRDFSDQTQVQIVYAQELVDGKAARGVEGDLTPTQALAAMLADTGLAVKAIDDTTIAIVTRAELERNAAASLDEESAPQPFRVAQLDQGEDVRGVDRDNEFDDERVEDTIVVTGTTIRGVYPGSAPLDVYTADDIQLSGATTLNRFLETLPQNLNSLAPGSQALGPGEGSAVGGGGIDLRGLGLGTTLVLLNGQRLTSPGGQSPDTSLIPLGAVERVEILTDGASAIYGSDAVAGVVNFILRDDFEGASISASYGGATRGGHDRFQADAAVGTSWDSGSGFLSYSYVDQSALEADDREFSSQTFLPQSLVPSETKHGVLGSINQDVTERLSLFGSVFYSQRDSEFFSSTSRTNSRIVGDQEQVFASAGLSYEITEHLNFQIDGTYVTYEENQLSDVFSRDRQAITEEDGNSLDLMAKIDGKLIDLPGGEAKFSIGGGHSEQEFNTGRATIPSPITFTEFDRDSQFAFAETFVPVIGSEQNIPGIDRLEVNAAVRYTDYSDFGGAWTPRVGVLWSPTPGLNLRGTYARAFRAPTLRELDPNSGFAQIFSLLDFGFPDSFSNDGSTILLLWGGVSDQLEPEFSDTFTIGFDIEPVSIPRLKLSATYYNIDYTDRLGLPSANFALEDQAGFAFVFNDSPNLNDFESIVSSVPQGEYSDFSGLLVEPVEASGLNSFVTVVFDGRLTNLAESKAEGIDLSLDYGHSISVGDLNYGLRMTKTLESIQRDVPVVPEFSLLDTVGNPVSLKLRGFVGFSRGGFTGQINVNHIDSYENTTVDPVQSIDSWTTIDLSVRYAFEESGSSLLDGTSVSLNVNNLFDEDPPFVAPQQVFGRDGLTRSVGFDPVNANAVGRFVTIQLTKQF